MRSIILSGVAVMAGLLASQSVPASIRSAPETRLSATWGGQAACFSQVIDRPCGGGTTCKPNGPGSFASIVATNQVRAACGPGTFAVSCTPITPMPCATTTFCTDAKCTTCDPPATANVNSQTNMGGACPPPPPPPSSNKLALN